MRKRVSLRRWKARCAIGRMIPMTAIVDHQLDRWFRFTPGSLASHWYKGERK